MTTDKTRETTPRQSQAPTAAGTGPRACPQDIAVRQHTASRQRRWASLAFFLLSSVLCLPITQAQGTLEGSREKIQRYNAEIQRLSKSDAPPPSVTPAQATEAATTEAAAPPFENAFAPAMPQFDLADTFQTQTRDRDPFELLPGVAAQEGGASGLRSSFLDDANLSRAWRLKALARGPSGGIAQIQLGRGEIVTVYDGDELSLDGRAYTVQVESDGLVLSFVPKDPNSQQRKVRVR